MEEKPFKALTRPSGCHDSMKSHSRTDIRNLWTTATLSQPRMNVQFSIYEDSNREDSSAGGKTRGWYNQKAGHDSDGSWEEWEDGNDNVSVQQEELDEDTLDLELRPCSSLGSHLEVEDDHSRTEMEMLSSMPSLHLSKYTPHRAHWVEQQTRLPLPLVDHMENEALEILTKALQSYRSGIGRNHFLTKQLQRYIEGLKGRRNKRLHVSVQ